MRMHLGDKPCHWSMCMNKAFGEYPVCWEHAMQIWRDLDRRGLGLSPRAPSQYSATAGHPVVYYVTVRPGVVKIGTTANIVERVAQLRLDWADVLALEPGGFPKESHRHKEFRACRIGRREDFTLTDELRAHIETIRETFGDPGALAEEQRHANAGLLAEIGAKR